MANEGIFDDASSILDSGHEDQHNPVTQGYAENEGTDEEDDDVEQALIAIFDENGQPRVAMTEDGERIEDWRTPSREEASLLSKRGRMVRSLTPAKSAVGEAAFDYEDEEVEEEGMTGWKLAAAIATAAVVGAGGLWLYQRSTRDDDDGDDDEAPVPAPRAPRVNAYEPDEEEDDDTDDEGDEDEA